MNNRVKGIMKLQPGNRFLNMYNMAYVTPTGKDRNYYMVSRRKEEDLACMTGDHNKDEAVAIYKATVTGEISLDYKEENEDIEIIILKQQDINKFLEEHVVAIRTALILKSMAI